CFFLQDEDVIRSRHVTGVQTCALPILSPGTSDVLPYFDFSLAVSSTGIHDLCHEEFYQSRNLSYGEGFGAAKWWRRSIIRAAERGDNRGNTVRLSVSGRNLSDK